LFGSIHVGALLNLPNTVVSELWTRKMRTFLRRMDFDGDGVVTKTDFENMPARFADLEGFDPVKKEAAINCFRVVSIVDSRFPCHVVIEKYILISLDFYLSRDSLYLFQQLIAREFITSL